MSITVNAGTIVGPHHLKRGEENQDAFVYLTENGYGVIAVADGAGSLPLSHIGAHIASSTAANEAMDALNSHCSAEEAVQKGIELAREALLNRDDVDKIGCTLAVGVITDEGWATGVVGDAFAVVSYDVDSHDLVQPEAISEYANVTKLLTSKDYNPLYVSGDEEIIALTVSSDGLEDTSLKDNFPSAGFWNPVISRALEGKMDVQAFLYYMNDNEKIYDDTTLVIATRDR